VRLKYSAMQSINPHDYRLSVAPMMDWTDRHCRYFHRLLSPRARLYTEMVTSAALVRGKQLRLLEHSQQEHPVALQLGGSDPHELAQAARLGAEAGYDEINLNVGCPSDRVQSGRFGACLMREPALVGDCVKAMRDAVAVPVTVKCRIGVDDQDDYADLQHFTETMLEAGRRHAGGACAQGLAAGAVAEGESRDSAARLRAGLPAQARISAAGGGDQRRHHHGRRRCRRIWRQVDGVMLGRAAYHDPYLLAQIEAASMASRCRSATRRAAAHAPYVEAELARGTALKHISRHLLGLYQGEPGARAFRRTISEGAHLPGAGWS
jgi:tRNA-dihydrouridine synthase A